MTRQQMAVIALAAIERHDPRGLELLLRLTMRFLMPPDQVIANIRRLAAGEGAHA